MNPKSPLPAPSPEDLGEVARSISGSRWAALATLGGDGAPQASWVAYVPDPAARELLLHLSRLAAHTGNLLAQPRAGLGISAADRGEGDPQTLPRVSLQGTAEAVARDDPAWPGLRARYIDRLPDAAPLFDFPDFVLFRFRIESGRWVGGFGRIFDFDPATLPTRTAA
jgi:putative heme iron utilization protein